MKLRKFAAMTMAVAMLGGTLAGCGGAASSTASSSADSTPAESTSTAESTETSDEKVNIKLFTGKIETIDVMNEIIDEFSGFSDWMDKYSYIIEMGNALPPIDERHKTPDNIIEGCQSRVWLNAEYRDGKIHFEADSDAIIVKGIISMLVRVLSDQTPADILDANLYFIDSIGLTEHLSPTRSNGLLAMVKQIKMYALAYKTKEQQQQ